jgi:chitin disaccharide deacetylase
MSKKRLIVNADDFGQSEGINEGIIKAHEQGIVTSASLLVRYSHASDAAAYAKSHPTLGVGLHIDFGEWIYNYGNWHALYEVVSLDDDLAVKNEIERQLEAFYKIMRRKPTHIDSHQHIHLRKSIRPIVIDIAKQLNVTLRRCNDRVFYCGDFYGQYEDGSPFHEAITPNGLNATVSRLPDGITELACHPALRNDVKTMYSVEREIEVKTLCNPSIKETIDKLDIELCSFEGIGF